MNVLIVDDSRAMRMIVRRTLRQAGLNVDNVVEAENGKDALDKLRDFRPDLILSDWNMPELDGMGLLRTLRNHRIMVPFGFVTAQGSSEMREKARMAGANFLISKPFTPETFADVLGSMIKAA
jgi:two-component system chemotaxis response regulator CheY